MITKNTSLKTILNLAPACSCHSCQHGCTIGSGFLVDEDKEKIADFLNITTNELKEKYLEEVELFNKKILKPKLLKKPFGKCIFFEKGCKIHPVKPLQCKVSMGCKDYGEELSLWFMLNHIIDADDPESIRQFKQYLNSGGKTLPQGKLKDLVPDDQKLKKILDYQILR